MAYLLFLAGLAYFCYCLYTGANLAAGAIVLITACALTLAIKLPGGKR